MGLFGPPNVDKMKAKKNVKGLIKALGYQQSPLVRFSAAQALGQLGDARAVEPLIAALEDAPVRQAAADALHKLGWQPHQDRVGATFWILCKQWDRCAQIGAPAVEPLMAALVDGDFSTRQAAAQALVGHLA